jgi:RES domain-containing protein
MAVVVPVSLRDTHRLIPAKYAEKSVLEKLQLDLQVIHDLSELDAVTNERKIAEAGNSPSIGPQELLYGVPEAHIINAAFTHAGPDGGRFNNRGRGAWYAGEHLVTAQAEVAFHRERFLADSRITEPIVSEYQDFLADFSGKFHELDSNERKACLQPDPVPHCYAPGQALAASLLSIGSNGILYPSVRVSGETCIACFRPALVNNPRRGDLMRLRIKAGAHVHWTIV